MTTRPPPRQRPYIDVLDAEVASLVLQGGHVEYRDERRAVVVFPPNKHHVAHLVLTILTLGAWLIPWLFIALWRIPDRRVVVEVDEDGYLVAPTRPVFVKA